MRWGLLLVAAGILPSCWHDHHPWSGGSPVVHVTVENIGTGSADIRAEADYWSGFGWEDPLNLTAPANHTTDFYYGLDNLTRLTLAIYRSSDGLELYHDSWDRQDLDHLDEDLTITIDP
ncbi:MAG TPA: hypothetical protein VKU80_17475 [Planctomycetota bacterium]|nr:hypothetical protein [Planctomycetota bacterium]